MKNRNKKGFTITELVIVIAVIAILAAVLIPTFSNVISNAKESAAMQACHAAMTEYSSVNAVEGETVLVDGLVFVSDGHMFAYVNRKLNFIGKFADVAVADKTAATATNALKKDGVAVLAATVTADTTPALVDANAAYVEYSFEVKNVATYSGYFVYEQLANLANVYEGVLVCRGIVVDTGAYTIA